MQLIVSVFVLLISFGSVSCAPDQYPILQASGSCIVKLVPDALTVAPDSFSLNESDSTIRAVTLQLAVVNTGWQPKPPPWSLSLVNPGYVDASDHQGFTLATAVEYGYASSLYNVDQA